MSFLVSPMKAAQGLVHKLPVEQHSVVQQAGGLEGGAQAACEASLAGCSDYDGFCYRLEMRLRASPIAAAGPVKGSLDWTRGKVRSWVDDPQ